jgi:hypothetical protein
VGARPGHQATVTPPVAGQLLARPGGALPQLGSRVEAGEVLALVQPRLVGSELVTFLIAFFTCFEYIMRVGIQGESDEGDDHETLLDGFTDTGCPGL